jgi:alpha-L-fucosidase
VSAVHHREIGDIALMGSDEKIKWSRDASGLTIQLPKSMPEQLVIGFRISAK